MTITSRCHSRPPRLGDAAQMPSPSEIRSLSTEQRAIIIAARDLGQTF